MILGFQHRIGGHTNIRSSTWRNNLFSTQWVKARLEDNSRIKYKLNIEAAPKSSKNLERRIRDEKKKKQLCRSLSIDFQHPNVFFLQLKYTFLSISFKIIHKILLLLRKCSVKEKDFPKRYEERFFFWWLFDQRKKFRETWSSDRSISIILSYVYPLVFRITRTFGGTASCTGRVIIVPRDRVLQYRPILVPTIPFRCFTLTLLSLGRLMSQWIWQYPEDWGFELHMWTVPLHLSSTKDLTHLLSMFCWLIGATGQNEDLRLHSKLEAK